MKLKLFHLSTVLYRGDVTAAHTHTMRARTRAGSWDAAVEVEIYPNTKVVRLERSRQQLPVWAEVSPAQISYLSPPTLR